jgi:hypothetical protein
MTRYFVAGNFWLTFALVLFLGQRSERSGPRYYSFFGGAWLSPTSYFLVTLFCAALAATFFVLTWRTRSSRNETVGKAAYADVDLECVSEAR